MRLVIAILVLSFGTFARASEIVRLVPSGLAAQVSHNGAKPWKKEDAVCAVLADNSTACGRIVEATSRGAILQFSPKSDVDRVEKGQMVVAAASQEVQRVGRMSHELEFELLPLYRDLHFGSVDAMGPVPKLAIGANTESTIKTVKEKEWNLTVGLNWYYPQANLEMKIGEGVTFGVSPGYFKLSKVGITSSMIGVRGSLNYYFSRIFQGFFGQAGVGVYRGTSQYNGVEGAQSVTSVDAVVGWRVLLGDRLNCSLAVGGQFFHLPKTDKLRFTLQTVDPAIMIDFGWLL